MTLKLNAGLSRKVADGNYGSRGASVNIELELDSGLVNDPPKLHEKIKKLFSLVRTSVDEELNANHQPTEPRAPATANGNGTGNGPNSQRNGSRRQATQSQTKALHAIARNRRIDLGQFLAERFNVNRPEALDIKAASQAIDALKGDGEGSGS
jgi:hypothetical protein